MKKRGKQTRKKVTLYKRRNENLHCGALECCGASVKTGLAKLMDSSPLTDT